MPKDRAIGAVLSVRAASGFVVRGPAGPLVITAAHCLPYLPPSHAASYARERTYEAVLGERGAAPNVWAECLFADPISDLAILGRPDADEFSPQADKYDALLAGAGALNIGDAPKDGPALLPSRDGMWFRARIRRMNGRLWIYDAAEPITGGMSGSPILNDAGEAIGVCCIGARLLGEVEARQGGPNPRLKHNLPLWALADG